MRFRHSLLLLLVLLVNPGLPAENRGAQADATAASYQAKRQKAVELFSQGRRLEALPLLEELVRSKPRDDEMLMALAASLVEHAATLTDQEAAGKERLRARDLLDQAWRLGNTSTLGQNLAHLMRY